MQSKRYLSSKYVFIVFVAIFLCCLCLFVRYVPLSILNVIITPAWLIWVPTGIVAFIKMAKYTQKNTVAKKNNVYNPFPFKSVVCFVASVLIAIILHEGIAFVAREEVKTFLHGVSPNVRVYIDNQQAENTNQIINELSKIKRYQYHSSHSTNEIPIEIVNGDKTLKIVLGRDSRYPQWYFVYYLKYSSTSTNEVGGIKTVLFDDY